MTAAATTRATPRTPWSAGSPSSSSRARQKQQQQSQTNTPNGFPPGRTPASVGQTTAPHLSPRSQGRTSSKGPTGGTRRPRSPSPGYFGLTVTSGSGSPNDSEAGPHARGNWKTASSSLGSKAATSPQPVPHDQNPDLSDFRRQSEVYAMNVEYLHRIGSGTYPAPSSPLATAPVRTEFDQNNSLLSPLTTRPRKQPRLPSEDRMDTGARNSSDPIQNGTAPSEDEMMFSPVSRSSPIPRSMSPTSIDSGAVLSNIGSGPHLSHIDERQHRLSLPQNRVEEPPPGPPLRADSRSQSMPQHLSREGPTLVEPSEVVQILNSVPKDNVLLLDLRVSPQYASSHLSGSLNLCIPTTLLKRPSFNIPRLSDTFSTAEDKARFAKWQQADYILVYDANSTTIRDAVTSMNTLKKFSVEGWKGLAGIIKGGFQAFSQEFPDYVERAGRQLENGKGPGLSIQPNGGAVKVAGGCPMPSQKSAANPFFSNIRQNMDLIGGVGQVSVTIPEAVGPRTFGYLPQWLQEAAKVEDAGKRVSDTFLQIEKDEQKRMQSALSADVSYGTPRPKAASVQIAGIEKGSKNRYKDMLPFDHSRVRLQDVRTGGCDYVNASHIKAGWSNRKYIATQAPVPATFEDFWRMIWEQDIRVIVMLTAETEGGQQKCHPYWVPSTHGPMKVKALSEKRVALAPPSTLASKVKRAQLSSPLESQPHVRRRGVTNPVGLSQSVQDAAARDANPNPPSAEIPYVLVRKLTLSHSNFPFQQIREITQLQFSAWPDFGAISARDVLGLVEQTNAVARVYNNAGSTQAAAALPVREDERPIAVHCSAGCGRTGTFCTIDSVIDMLKRQNAAAGRLAKRERDEECMENGHEDGRNGQRMEVDGEDGWVMRDDVDLVAKTVEDFRQQRLSMVQTLKQFVLCYEAVMEWLVKEMPERFRKEQARRSFQGELGDLH